MRLLNLFLRVRRIILVYVESLQRRQDGEKRLLGWWCRSLKDEKGKVIGTISAAQDITDRRQAEQALQESIKITGN
jgi:PAS domain S-box-containing protein